MIEHRTARLEVRADPADPRRFWIRTLPYNVVDNFRTTFAPGVMGDLLDDPPTLLYGHDHTNLQSVLGRAIDARDHDGALDVRFELDDPEAVPAARQAAAQLRSGTLRRFSVGFERLTDEPDKTRQGVTRITRARLLEVSIVLDPAVPGTGVLAMRAAGQQVTLDLIREIAGYLRDGLVSRDQAHQLLADNTTPDDAPPPVGSADVADGAAGQGGAVGGAAGNDPTAGAAAEGAAGGLSGEPPNPPAEDPAATAALADAAAALDLVRHR